MSVDIPQAIEAVEADVKHAVKEAMRRLPDYPWNRKTASEAVWALGESLLGTEAANRDWQELVASKDAEIERLRADAERYRWLRGQKERHSKSRWYVKKTGQCSLLGDALDAAIDAALSGRPPSE